MKTEVYILIGGRSSRLGIDKAFVELGGKTLLTRAAETVREGLPESRVTAVAGNATQFAIDAIVADIPFIFDLHENRGPLGGLHAAVSQARSPWIFVMACDYPFVTAEFIALLAEKVSDDFGAVLPEQQDGRLQPLCGFYRVEAARPIVDEIIDRPRVPPPMHEIVSMMDPRIVRFDEYSQLDGSEQMFMNINTPDDLERARS